MKNLFLILFLGFISLTTSFAQTNQGSNPSAVDIAANNLALGETGDLDVVVANTGFDPMVPGTFRVRIGIDASKMEFVLPLDYISSMYPDWTVVSVSGSQLVLVNTNGEISPSEGLAFQIKVRAKVNIPVGEADLSLNVGITPGMSNLAGNTDNSSADDNKTSVIVLPVTLVSFTAGKENKIALLNWVTTEETNSNRFDVQRSADGKKWQVLGSVKSNGESVTLRNYSFTDKAPKNGENLYRLKMIDRDGTFAYSSIKAVRFEGMMGNDQPLAYVYPNPSSDRVYLNSTDLAGAKQAVVLDMNGRAVLSTSAVADGVDVRKLAEGTYMLKVSGTDGSSAVHRFVISR